MEAPRHWRSNKSRLRFTDPSDPENELYFLRKGELFSFTNQHAAPAEYKSFEPYIVGLVLLPGNRLITAQITDAEFEELYIGQKVEMITRYLRDDKPEGRGMRVYGYKFRPIISKNKIE